MPMWALLFGDMMDAFGTMTADEGLMDQVKRLALSFFFLGLASQAASYMKTGLWMLTSARQSQRIRAEYMKAVLLQEVAFFDKEATTGKLLTCMNEDTVLLEQAIGEKVGMFLEQAGLFVTGLTIAFINGWDLTLVMLAVMPVLGVAGAFLFRVMGTSTQRSSDAYAEANGIAAQALAAVRTVFSFNAEEGVYKAYASKLECPENIAIRQSYVIGSVVGFFQVAMYSAYALAFWYASERVIKGAYTGGQVLTVFFSALIGGFATAQASPLLGAFQKGRVAGARLFQIIDRKPAMGHSQAGAKIDSLKGEVELSGVDFAYPTRPDKKVFDNVSLKIKAGQTVALVGQSGSGKSTIVSLIERFYDPAAGKITLDGVPLPDLDLAWLRDQVGLVNQEPTLFATTIHQNILYGNPDATEQMVHDAARAANAHAFISVLPDGYGTMVGEAGVQMSGGQKQRIAIARAILKNPRVLLLDEATSALDAQSERLVQQALNGLMRSRTTVVVAHRLSTIRNADVICVVQDGCIVEQGSHEDLLRDPEGAYSQLFKLQQHSAPSPASGAVEDAPQRISVLPHSSSTGVVIDEEESLELQKAEARAMSGSGMVYPSDDTAAPLKQAAADLEAGNTAAPSGTGASSGKDVSSAPKVGLGRLLAMNRDEWHLAVLGCLAAAGLGCAMPALALALSSMIATFYIDTSTPEGEQLLRDQSRTWSLVFVGIGLVTFLLTFVAQACFGIMGAKLSRRVRVLLFRALLTQEVGWFDKEENNSGALTSRLGTDAQHVRGAVGDSLALMTQNLCTCVAGLSIAFISGWKMTLVILATVPFLVVSGLITSKMQQRAFGDGQASSTMAAANQVASEAFRHSRIIHAFNMHSSVLELWQGFTAADLKRKVTAAHVSGLATGFAQFAIFSVYGLAFWVGGMLVDSGEMTMEDMLKVFFSVVFTAMGAAQAQNGFPDTAKAGVALQRIFSVVDREPEIDPNVGAPAPASMTGAVGLSSVRFSYPSRPGQEVLHSLSLEVPAGKMVALVGESGSGKSTIVGLVERFYDASAGSVKLDGREIRELPLRWVRANVGLVSQEPTLFSMTVKENIKLGVPTATDEEVVAAATTANAHGFIAKLPEGYDTLIGEQGVQLSGGQKQRVAIARAVLKDPRVLLLDEATSALDAESERLVQDALERLMEGRTTVVVAHRLSTIRKANTIAVMKTGRIIEQGSHDELLCKPDGAYSSLISLQQAAEH